MSSISPVLLFAVATFSTCNPSSTPSSPAPSDPGPGTVTLPAWTLGSVDVDSAPSGASTLVDVRHGTHDGFDRIVFEFAEAVPSYHVEYVDAPQWQCGSGEEVWLSGDAWLQIDLEPTNAHTEEGEPTLDHYAFAPDYDVLFEARQVCDFEAVVSWVAGTGSPNGFRVFELDDPARLVVDIKH